MRIYPTSHRTAFASEMKAVFDEAAQEQRKRGSGALARFALKEACGIATAALAEWSDVLRPRQRALSEMEPAQPIGKIALTEQRIQLNLRRMEHAIANHQFTHARFYSEVDRRYREELSALKNSYDRAMNPSDLL